MTRVPFNYTFIMPGIVAGSIPTSQNDIDTLRGIGIENMLTLTRRDISQEFNLTGLNFCQAAIPDNGIPDNLEIAFKAVDFLAHTTAPVYLHCRGGIGRTGLIALAFFVWHQGLSLEEAKKIVSVRRNYEGNASAIDQGSPQKEWIDALPSNKLLYEEWLKQ